MGKREHGIQTRTVDLLYQTYELITVRVKHGTAFATAGDPDLYGCIAVMRKKMWRLRGTMFAFEVKNEEGKLTKIQQHRLHEFARSGAIVGAIRDPSEAVHLLEEAIKDA